MTETPETSRRPIWMYETPPPPGSRSHSDLLETSKPSQHERNSDLVGVLEQVSELTMEDDAFNASNGLRTPVALNPRPSARPFPMLDEASKRKPSPFLTVRKKVRRGSCSTARKLSTAPPLPSSPDLSAGGEIRMIPPQFSPLGSSHIIDIAPLLMRKMEESEEEMKSPDGFPPAAPPPTPQVASLPPPMPWFESPEQEPRKVFLKHSLQMKKGPFSLL